MSNALGSRGVLHQNESLRSADGTHQLLLQGDGNLVVLRNGQPVWNAWTSTQWKFPGQQIPASHLTMEPDGNLVLYNADGPLWESDTHHEEESDRYSLLLQDDGTFEIQELGSSLWEQAVGQ